MNILQRRQFAENLLFRSLISDLSREWKYSEVHDFVSLSLVDYRDDFFYDEFFALLYNSDDEKPLVSIFFAIRSMEVVHLIHRRLFDFKTSDFFRLVVPIFFEFSQKVSVIMDKSDSQVPLVVNLELVSPGLISKYQRLGYSSSNLFCDENCKNFVLYHKSELLLFIYFFEMLFDNVYEELNSPIYRCHNNKKELQARIKDLGCITANPLTGLDIDDVFFLFYYQREMKLMYRLYCHHPVITSSVIYTKVFLRYGFHLALTFFVNYIIPKDTERVQLLHNNVGDAFIRFDGGIQVVNRIEFLTRLWNLDLV